MRLAFDLKTSSSLLNMADSQETEPKVIIRRAELRDKTGVIQINTQAYDGLDYLPCIYEDLINDANYSYYVAEIDNTIVACYGVCPIDGGRSLMARSARVKDGYEKLGLLGKILRVIHRDFSPLCLQNGGLKVASAMGETCKLLSSSRFLDMAEIVWTRIQTHFVLNVDPPIQTKANKEDTVHDNLVKELNQEDFVSFVEGLPPSRRRYLFPANLFTTFTWHFNIDHLRASKPIWGCWDTLVLVHSSLLGTSVLHPEPVNEFCELSNPASEGGSNITAEDMEELTPEYKYVDCDETPLSSKSEVFGKSPSSDCIYSRLLSDTSKTDSEFRHGRGKNPGGSSVLVSFMGVMNVSGFLTYVDVFGDVTEPDDVIPHLRRLAPWIGEQCKRRGFEGTAHVLAYTNSPQEEAFLTTAFEKVGFCHKDFYMKKMHYIYQDFDTLI